MNKKITASIAIARRRHSSPSPLPSPPAHTSRSARTQAAAGSYALVTIKVPNESATAVTNKVELDIPTDTPFAQRQLRSGPGLDRRARHGRRCRSRSTIERRRDHGGRDDRHLDGAARIGDHRGAAAALPAARVGRGAGHRQDRAARRCRPTATATVVSWSETTENAEHPAPVLYVNDAPGRRTARRRCGDAQRRARPSCPGRLRPPPTTCSPAGSASAASCVGAVGLVVGIVARRRASRPMSGTAVRRVAASAIAALARSRRRRSWSPRPAQAHNYLVAVDPAGGRDPHRRCPTQFSITTNDAAARPRRQRRGLRPAGDGCRTALYYGDGCVDRRRARPCRRGPRSGPRAPTTVIWQVVSTDGHTVYERLLVHLATVSATAEPSAGSTTPPDCDGRAEAELVGATATAAPTAPAPQPRPTMTSRLGDVLWIGGAVLAVGLAIAVDPRGDQPQEAAGLTSREQAQTPRHERRPADLSAAPYSCDGRLLGDRAAGSCGSMSTWSMRPYSSASLAAEDLVAVDVLVHLLHVRFECCESVSSSQVRMRRISRGLDLDVRRLAAARLAGGRLVDEDARVRQREALAGVPAASDARRRRRPPGRARPSGSAGGCTASCRRSPSSR